MYLDVRLFKKIGNAVETKLSVLADTMQLSLTLDDKFINADPNKNRIYKIIRVHDRNAEILNTTYDAKTKTITFGTDRFSSYALIYEDIDIIDNPDTYDNISFYIDTALISLIAISGITIIITRK